MRNRPRGIGARIAWLERFALRFRAPKQRSCVGARSVRVNFARMRMPFMANMLAHHFMGCRAVMLLASRHRAGNWAPVGLATGLHPALARTNQWLERKHGHPRFLFLAETFFIGDSVSAIPLSSPSRFSPRPVLRPVLSRPRVDCAALQRQGFALLPTSGILLLDFSATPGFPCPIFPSYAGTAASRIRARTRSAIAQNASSSPLEIASRMGRHSLSSSDAPARSASALIWCQIFRIRPSMSV